MENRAWLWRKRSSEKTIVTSNKTPFSAKGLNEEAQKLPPSNEVEPVRHVRNLNEKLASVLLDNPAKDDDLTKKEKLTEETVTGQEKVQAEAVICQEEASEVVKHQVAATERILESDTALKQCIQQLSALQEEQEKKIKIALMKVSSESEKEKRKLEEKLMDMSKKLADVAIENANLSKALLVKEKLVEESHKRLSQTAAEFNTLMARLDSTEKENAFLKYEFHMLEKELEVRNEELEYNHQSVDALHRQHLESVKKITRLEAECQRLRVLMRKRLPSPAAFGKIRREAEMLGTDRTELRKKPNLTRDLILREATKEVPAMNTRFLTEKLRCMDEENKSLKDVMAKKNAELQFSRIMFSRTASRLSQVESQLLEHLGGHKSLELSKCSSVSKDLSPATNFDSVSDGVSSSGSWANALVSELEHFRDRKVNTQLESKASEVSDMSLMDDFVEMEKLALVSAKGETHHFLSGMEIFPANQVHLDFHNKDVDLHNITTDKPFDWLQDVLKAILKQQKISNRAMRELYEDIGIALGYVNHQTTGKTDTEAISKPSTEFYLHGCIALKSPEKPSAVDAAHKFSNIDISVKEKRKQCDKTKLTKSICKIVELVEGIKLTHPVRNHTGSNGSKVHQTMSQSASPADYYVRVVQWNSYELSAVLQRFLSTCNSLLNGKDGLEYFAEELSFTLDWILNNYVTAKDDSRDKIRKHFGWNDLGRENEVCFAANVPPTELDSIDTWKEDPVTDIKYHNMEEKNNRLKDELKDLESLKKEMENKLQEQEQKVEGLKAELENLKESKEMIEDQMENQKTLNEDLDTHLSVAKSKLNEVLQKFSSLEVELEDKSNCCEELEATCLELQLQLESVAKCETLNNSATEDGKQPQTGWEISAASIKLAECQETILNLGKQLKALASPREAVLFDKVFSTSNETAVIRNKALNKRFSLRDQMVAEDSAKAIILRSPAKEAPKPSSNHPDNANALANPNVIVSTLEEYKASKNKDGNTAVSTLAIVPRKKHGLGFLRRLLMRKKKKGVGKKPQLMGKV